jgi:hypothetical protein
MKSRWRTKAISVIQQVISEHSAATVDEQRRLAEQAYPFGPRSNHPYRIWRKTMNEVFGKKIVDKGSGSLPLFGEQHESN